MPFGVRRKWIMYNSTPPLLRPAALPPVLLLGSVWRRLIRSCGTCLMEYQFQCGNGRDKFPRDWQGKGESCQLRSKTEVSDCNCGTVAVVLPSAYNARIWKIWYTYTYDICKLNALWAAMLQSILSASYGLKTLIFSPRDYFWDSIVEENWRYLCIF